MSTFKNIYVTFKVTLKCNLACRYCYGRDNYAQGTEMSDDEIQRGLRFVCKYASIVGAESITICWHGGEPFLLARKLPAIIKYANDLFAENGIRVSHGTQTNATLLGPDTYDLINTCFAGFVGVSIDLFSSYRTFPSGKDSTEIAVRNIDNALSSGIRCGAINLITRDNLDRIDDIYDFYKKRKMNVRLSRVFPISNSDVLSSPMYISDEEYAEAMIRFFDRWADDPEPAPNTDIVKLIADLLLGVPSLCLREADCHKRYMAFSPGGDIFSCAEFDVPESVIGNFLEQAPEEFIKSNAREKIAAMAPVPEKCRQCRFEPTCHGGCFRERFMLGYPYRCKSNMIYWNRVVDWIESKGGGLYILKGKTIGEKRSVIDKILNTK
jgi:Arylsulfatase regulator (Fe-S oxidoreductase)